MAGTNEKELAPGGNRLLEIHRFFSKASTCRTYERNFLCKEHSETGGRVCNHFGRYFLPPFAHVEVVEKDITIKKHITHAEGISSDLDMEIELPGVRLQGSQGRAKGGSSRVIDSATYSISYKLSLNGDQIGDETKEFWGSPFRTLLQIANEKVDTRNRINKLYHEYGTHFISYVAVGTKRDLHSESNQTSNTKRSAASAATSFLKLGGVLSGNKFSVKDKNVCNEIQTNYGNDETPIVLFMGAEPLWKLRPVRNIDGAAIKFKQHFFDQLEQQRRDWSPGEIARNYRHYCEQRGRARIDSKNKQWFLVLVKDERLRVRHDSTLRAFRCIVDRRCDVRFQIWGPETQYDQLGTGRKYRLIFEMEVKLLEGQERYEVTAEHIEINQSCVIGIMVPTNIGRNSFLNKHFIFPIKCEPIPADEGINIPTCWRMDHDEIPQLNNERSFKLEAFKDESGSRSVPLIGLEFKVSDIAYYKHMICEDQNDKYKIEFDDPHLDKFKMLDSSSVDIHERVKEILEELKAEMAVIENQVTDQEERFQTTFEVMCGAITERISSLWVY